MDEYFTKELCANFPPSQPCKCPIKAGEIQLKDLQITVPDPGYFAYVMSVSLSHFLFQYFQCTSPFSFSLAFLRSNAAKKGLVHIYSFLLDRNDKQKTRFASFSTNLQTQQKGAN